MKCTQRMTVREATEIALTAIDEAHDLRIDSSGFDSEHVLGALDCKCELGRAFRTLARKLSRAQTAAVDNSSEER